MVRRQMNVPLPLSRWLACIAMMALTARTASGTQVDTSSSSSSHGGLRSILPQQEQLRFNRTVLPDPFERLERYREYSREESENRKIRMRDQRERARAFLKKIPQPDPSKLERVEPAEFEEITADRKSRGLNWLGGDDVESSNPLADPSQYYDKWAQAYRMLGAFIDCDHPKQSNNNHRSRDGNNQKEGNSNACARWMMWAAYVNPNYQGNGYYEYFGENPVGVLDCHSSDSEWVLLGVYRQEFYQFIEQISKHLWAIDEYEYVVALAGLSYMTNQDCFVVGYDNSGNSIYAGVAPQPYGKFEIALYTDKYCLTPNNNLGKNFDSFGLTSSVYLGSKDNNNNNNKNGNNNNNNNYNSNSNSYVSDWWTSAQEYTLANLNEVYEEFKYCTSCVDYPTYQDGYFIGNYGTDDDDLINQCWKFHSHNSYVCEADCIAMGHAQGTILSIKYGDTTFGKTSSSFYSSPYNHATHGHTSQFDTPMARLLANAFLTASALLFVATFLAFAVARRSRYRESRGGRMRRLLDDDAEEPADNRSRFSRRGLSKGKEPGSRVDGLFRTRSKSGGDRKSRSASKGKKPRSKSREKGTYGPPSDRY